MSCSPIYAVQKQPSMIDYRGHLTALFFVSGCNFRCGFCHNAELLQKRKTGITWDRLTTLCENYQENWVDAVTISGGEPTLWEELPELVDFFRSYGFSIKLDTNGAQPERLKGLLPLIDYVAMDVKGAPWQYEKITGFKQVERIGESIDLLRRNDTKYEFRTTLIEGVHDTKAMQQLLAWIDGAQLYVLQPFLPRPDLPDVSLREKERTSIAFLQQMAQLAYPHVKQVMVLGS